MAFCVSPYLHNTAACLKKQKAEKEKKKGKRKATKRIQILKLKQYLKKEEMLHRVIREISLNQKIIDPLKGLATHVHKYVCVTWEINHQETTVTQTRKKTTILLRKLWNLITILKKKTMIQTCRKTLMTKYQRMKIMKFFKIGQKTLMTKHQKMKIMKFFKIGQRMIQ